ncbi:hypothetical protein DL765_000744 [Monosporascus sp. GIB2]|nr:hypothetical protein DL765_000744 [Monosporascus sp. GIB2]
MGESDKYEVLEKIGHGSFGVIRKVRRKADGFIMCRKEISYLKMSQKEREQLHAEFQILSGLKHPNIVAYYHREHLKMSQDLHLYMEYCGNGDLGRVIRELSQKNQYADEMFVWSIFSQLVTALYRCHYGVDPPEVGKNILGLGPTAKPKTPAPSITIIHRDLKPENKDNSVKLGDFGLSKMISSHDFASTYVGTPFYMSPEICAAERYTLKSDVWSLGCIIYELCAREPPFNAKSHYQLVQKIKEGRIAPLPRVYSAELFAVIKDCLRVNPDHRPDTATLLNLPVVRLMRKEKEAVELSKMLHNKNEALNRKIKEAEERLEAERNSMRQEIEASLRREWEVKARLEIDRLVNEEIEQLQQRFEAEVQARVQEELQKKSVTFGAVETQEFASSLAKSDFPHSIGGASTDYEFPSTTDITDLSIDSPEPQPLKKSTRTPFGRAQTMFERPAGTPMDVEMASPSPIAIASLSLSPRRNNATKAPSAHQPTIFDGTTNNEGKFTFRDPDNVFGMDSDDEQSFTIDSPTRPPRHLPKSLKNPFGPNRPVLNAAKTAPPNRLRTQASAKATAPPAPAPVSDLQLRHQPSNGGLRHQPSNGALRHQPSNGALRERCNSPNRRLSKIPSVQNLSGGGSVENGHHGSGPQRKVSGSSKRDPEQQGPGFVSKAAAATATKNNVKGRTLIELQQARAGGRPVDSAVSSAASSPKRGAFKDRAADRSAGSSASASTAAMEPPAVWDPEKDDMPSPFLVRRKPMARV